MSQTYFRKEGCAVVNFKQWFGLSFPHSLLISIMASAFCTVFLLQLESSDIPLCALNCVGENQKSG